MKHFLNNVRLSFEHLYKVDNFNNFSGAFLFEPNHAGVKALEEACDEVGKEKWGAKWPKIKLELKEGGKLLIQNGNKKASVDGYEGMLFINASNSVRPLVVDRDRTPLAEKDGKPYSGCYVNIKIDIWAQDNNEFGKRLNAQLQGVQFVRNGDKFGSGGVAEESDFDEIEDGADADDLV